MLHRTQKSSGTAENIVWTYQAKIIQMENADTLTKLANAPKT